MKFTAPTGIAGCAMAAAAALVAASTIGTALAQTSSWSHRATPQTPAASVPRGGPAKRTKSVPVKPDGKAQNVPSAVPPNLRQPLGRQTAAPSGDNAAYIAFDQGQYLTALRLASEQAKKGDPTAHTLVARIHAEGLGVSKNEGLAAQWYARGAELGDTEAVFAYGVLLAAGRGVKKDRTKAAQYFEAAAKKGHAYAHYNLALLFLTGDGKPENPHRAAAHLEYAAGQGILEAQYDLATLYQKGHGVEANAFKAAYWIRQAAARGLPAAQYDYAVMLLRGQGLNEDEPKAIEYLRAAAERGLPGAQNRLAYVYWDGITVAKNPAEAVKWRLLARSGGVKDKTMDDNIAKLPAKVRREATIAAERFREQRTAGIAQAPTVR